MRNYLLHALIISFVLFLTPTIRAASDVDEKVAEFKQAIRDFPDRAEAHYNLGVAYGKSGMYKEAIESFKQEIKLNHSFSKAHYMLGLVYADLGKHEEAIKALKEAMKILPDADTHYKLGREYFRINDRGSALEQYKILKVIDTERANQLFISIDADTK